MKQRHVSQQIAEDDCPVNMRLWVLVLRRAAIFEVIQPHEEVKGNRGTCVGVNDMVALQRGHQGVSPW